MMRDTPFRLLSPLAPAECAERLRAGLDESLPQFFPRAKARSILGVVGYVSGPMVHLRPRVAYSYATVSLTGTLSPRPVDEGGGTLLNAEFRWDPLTHVGSRVFAVLFCVLLLVGLVPTQLAGRWGLACGMAFVPPMIYFALCQQERYGRKQEQTLREFVVRALDTKPLTPSPNPALERTPLASAPVPFASSVLGQRRRSALIR